MSVVKILALFTPTKQWKSIPDFVDVTELQTLFPSYLFDRFGAFGYLLDYGQDFVHWNCFLRTHKIALLKLLQTMLDVCRRVLLRPSGCCSRKSPVDRIEC